MKIAITGTQGTGKSTLLNHLREDKALEGYEFIGEQTKMIKDKGFGINQEGSNLTQVLSVNVHLDNIFKPKYITDRCILDSLVYTRWLQMDEKVGDWALIYAMGMAEELLPKYDHIFYIPVEIPLVENGLRDTDEDFQADIEYLFEEYIKQYKIKVHRLTGSVEERAKEFKKVILS